MSCSCTGHLAPHCSSATPSEHLPAPQLAPGDIDHSSGNILFCLNATFSHNEIDGSLSFSVDCTGKCTCIHGAGWPRFNRIPWLPRPKTFAPLTQAEFIAQFVMNAANKSCEEQYLRHDTVQTFSYAFPPILPGRYHRMDSVALLQTAEVNFERSYQWLNAAHFLSSCSDRATIPFYNVMKGEKFYGPSKMAIEKCESAADFLLEPWVLVQLPFQPALFHQWAVAALAESLRYCRALVSVGTRGYLPQFHDLFTKMAKFSQTLTENCNIFLSQFFLIYCKNPEENIHIKAKKLLPEFSVRLAETLEALEFALSKDCISILNSMIESSWHNNNHIDKLKFISDASAIGSFNLKLEGHTTVYSDLYWASAGSVAISHCKKVSYTGQDRMEVVEYFRPPCNHRDNDFYKKALKHEIPQLLENFLKGLSSVESFIEYLMKSEDYPRLEKEYAFFRSNLGRLTNECSDGGVMLQLIDLQAEVYSEYFLSVIMRLLWHSAVKFDSNVYLAWDKEEKQTTDPSVAERAMEITETAAAQKEQWTLKNIFKKIKATCPATEVEADAESFTGRVQNLVMKMYERQYRTLKEGPFLINPECQYAHYVLPCFITTHLEVNKDPDLDPNTKNRYRKFVHELIKSYEEHEFIQELGNIKKMHYHNSYTYNKGKYNKQLQKTYDIFASIFRKSDKLTDTNILFRHIGESSEISPPKGHPKRKLFSPTESEIQISWLTHRIRESLIKSKMPGLETFEVHHQLDLLHALKQHKISLSDADHILEMRLASLEEEACCEFCETADKKRSQEALNKRYTYKVEALVMEDSKKLTIPQLFGICLHQAWSFKRDHAKFCSTYQYPLFPLDPFNVVTMKLLERDWWGLKEIFTQMWKDDSREEPSRISLKQAKKNAMCRPLLKFLNGVGKLKMEQPGQVTFFPIRHCRWCGLVYCKKFRLCAECEDEPDYMDKHYFCSENCETEALDAYHREEHASFVMKKLGLDV